MTPTPELFGISNLHKAHPSDIMLLAIAPPLTVMPAQAGIPLTAST